MPENARIYCNLATNNTRGRPSMQQSIFNVPTLGESDFSAFTAGWLLMVRKPFKLIFTS
jgi:hypothetical protein